MLCCMSLLYSSDLTDALQPASRGVRSAAYKYTGAGPSAIPDLSPRSAGGALAARSADAGGRPQLEGWGPLVPAASHCAVTGPS